jgi:hypothetical protein
VTCPLPGLIAEESEPLAVPLALEAPGVPNGKGLTRRKPQGSNKQSAALISCLDQLFLAAKVSEKEINTQKP